MANSIVHLTWVNLSGLQKINYRCGYCGVHTAPAAGYMTQEIHQGGRAYVCICSNCNKPTYVSYSPGDNLLEISPGRLMGDSISGLPEDVKDLYDEARKAASVGSYTASVLTCRKILMHIAVSRSAEEGKKFIEYIEYLSKNGYIPPHGKEWVEHIREKGNEANHEIKVMSAKEAETLIRFTEMLLRFIYEFVTLIPPKGETSVAENNTPG